MCEEATCGRLRATMCEEATHRLPKGHLCHERKLFAIAMITIWPRNAAAMVHRARKAMFDGVWWRKRVDGVWQRNE